MNTSQGLTVLYDVLKSDLSDATKRYLVEDFDTVLDLGLLEAAEKAMRPRGHRWPRSWRRRSRG